MRFKALFFSPILPSAILNLEENENNVESHCSERRGAKYLDPIISARAFT